MAGRLHIWCLFLGCAAAACSLIFCFVVVLVWEKGAWQTSKLWPLPTSWRNEIKHRSLIYSFALLHFLTFYFSKHIHITFDFDFLKSIVHWRLKCFVFLSRPFCFFFFKKKNPSSPWKLVKVSWVSRMGRNFDDYPGFQPKIPPSKHFSPQCTPSFTVRVSI